MNQEVIRVNGKIYPAYDALIWWDIAARIAFVRWDNKYEICQEMRSDLEHVLDLLSG